MMKFVQFFAQLARHYADLFDEGTPIVNYFNWYVLNLWYKRTGGRKDGPDIRGRRKSP